MDVNTSWFLDHVDEICFTSFHWFEDKRYVFGKKKVYRFLVVL